MISDSLHTRRATTRAYRLHGPAVPAGGLGGLFTVFRLLQFSFLTPCLLDKSLTDTIQRSLELCDFTMNGHTTAPSSYLDRLEAFRKSDTERDCLVAEVIRK